MGLTTMLEEYERLRSWRYHFTRTISDRLRERLGKKKWGSAESQTLLTLNLIL